MSHVGEILDHPDMEGCQGRLWNQVRDPDKLIDVLVGSTSKSTDPCEYQGVSGCSWWDEYLEDTWSRAGGALMS